MNPTVTAPNLATLTLKQLRLEKEETYWGLLLAITASCALWLILLAPLLLVGVGLLVCMQQLFLAHIRGNAVKVTAKQLPELYARVEQASVRLGLKTPPETYVTQAGGTLNAFATRLFSRNFVILYSDLIEACKDDPRALDFVIGHELGHIALGHLKHAIWLLPGRMVPLISQAYSRACEYSCDRCGLVVAGSLDAASRGLMILATGRHLAQHASPALFSQQAVDETKRFWAHIYELTIGHPYLSRRVRALRDFMAPGTEPALRRRFWAVILAPLLGQPVVATVVLMYTSIIVVSIAVPMCLRDQKLDARAEAATWLMDCKRAQDDAKRTNGQYATSLSALGLTARTPPAHYTLSMGDEHIGPLDEVPFEVRGFASPSNYACVASNNLDDDETWDVWVIDPSLTAAHLYVDDTTNEIHEWAFAQEEAEDEAAQDGDDSDD